MRHIVGSYLHILRLLCDFAKRINHGKAPQSANINELQPRHTPAPVTNGLAVCTGLCISQSPFLTRFDHSDGRLWHLCRHYSEIHSWNLELFFFFFSFTQPSKTSSWNTSSSLHADCFWKVTCVPPHLCFVTASMTEMSQCCAFRFN